MCNTSSEGGIFLLLRFQSAKNTLGLDFLDALKDEESMRNHLSLIEKTMEERGVSKLSLY